MTRNPDVPVEEYNAYFRKYMLKRYYDRRTWAVTLLGGKCVDCGTTEELQFDHDDPASKKFTISDRLNTAPLGVLKEELNKCLLRCRSCHLAKSKRNNELSHEHTLLDSTRVRVCNCGRELVGDYAYAGHKRYCKL